MTPRLNLYGHVGRDFSSATVATWLASHPDADTIDVHINSPGGDLFDGLTIHNALAGHPARVVVHIDGAALSAASYIAMSGDEILIAKNGVFMLHEPSITATGGNAADLEREVVKLRKLGETMVEGYATRTGKDPQAVRALLSADAGNGTWFSAEEAVAAGFADAVRSTQRIAALVGDWTPPSRIAAYIKDSNMPNPKPVSDLAKHAAAFDRHPEFFVNCLKEGKTMDEARTEYTAYVLNESDKLRAEVDRLNKIVAEYQNGEDPLTPNPAASIGYSGSGEPGDEDTYKAEWDENKNLRREFAQNFNVYASYRRAEDAGLVRNPRKRG